jgi:hypothetical protein
MQSATGRYPSHTFILYIVAVSFEKMRHRMANIEISIPYFDCLQKLTNFSYIQVKPAAFVTVTDESSNRNHGDLAFINSIPTLAKAVDVDISNLVLAAKESKPIYNESTYKEFHLLLCELLTKYNVSLNDLKGKNPHDTESILKALRKVWVFGDHLRTMVRSSAVETHLQAITDFLDVDTRKLWTHHGDLEEDADFVDFQHLKPHSMRKGKALLPWESYRDWLTLMVQYFDAAKMLISHISTTDSQISPPFSITILCPPRPETNMLPWTDVLKEDHFFPTLPGDTSGEEFIQLLRTGCLTNGPPLVEALKFAKKNLLIESNLLAPDSSTKIDAIAQQVANSILGEPPDGIVKEIVALKESEPQGRLAEARAIVEKLGTLSTRNLFYTSLKNGPLERGDNFYGKYHCEAYVASLITFLSQSESGQDVSDFVHQLDDSGTLPVGEINQIKEVLTEMKASHVFMRRLNLSDFNNRIAGMPSECLNDAARCVLSYSIC